MEALANRIGIEAKELLNEVERPGGPRLDCLIKLSDDLDIGVEELIAGEVDVEWVYSQNTLAQELPEKYRVGAGSRVRSSLSALHFARSVFGQRFVRSILRETQMPRGALSDPERKVSIRFLADLLDSFTRRGFEQADLREMGFRVASVPENRPVANALRGAKNSKQVYEWICQELSELYDLNFKYEIIQFNPNSLLMKIRPRSEIQDSFKNPIIGSRAVCVHRQGVMMAQPTYLGLPVSRIQEHKCLYLGDAACIYELTTQR